MKKSENGEPVQTKVHLILQGASCNSPHVGGNENQLSLVKIASNLKWSTWALSILAVRFLLRGTSCVPWCGNAKPAHHGIIPVINPAGKLPRGNAVAKGAGAANTYA